MRTIDEFYETIIKLASEILVFPATIESIVYDPRFNMPCVIDELTGEPDRYYYIPIGDMETMVEFGSLQYICDSSDITEQFECGDYNYYCGFLNDECPILYQQPSHSWVFPSRVIFYTPHFQIEMSTDHLTIHVYETVQKIRNMFLIQPMKAKLEVIKEMLFNSDRPRLDN